MSSEEFATGQMELVIYTDKSVPESYTRPCECDGRFTFKSGKTARARRCFSCGSRWFATMIKLADRPEAW